MPIPKLISKTKLLRGFRCLKCIYLTVHHPELEAPITDDLQALFDQGNQVGEIARSHFPGGVLVDHPAWDFIGSLRTTREFIEAGHNVIYEAAFEYAGCYARADIIVLNNETKRWKLFEVKSTTKVKPEHITDLGIQTWIMAKSGLPIEQINLMHLNTECAYPNLDGLFISNDVTNELRENYLSIQPTVRNIIHTISAPTVPDVDLGPYCLSPTECGFKSHCFDEKNIPALSVFNMPGLRDKKWQYYYDGIINITDERLSDLNEIQARIKECHAHNTRYVDIDGISNDITNWKFPLIFLDFETINPAIPRYQGCHPYQHVPFQFSVHVLTDWDKPPTHYDYLHDDRTDPRPSLITKLLEACGSEGSIVAYYSNFEVARIKDLCDYSPDHAAQLESLIERFVDPLPIIREHIYDPAFNASFSLKSVAPALLGDYAQYDDMLVANGSDAQRAFESLTHHDTPLNKRNEIKTAMLRYCEKDTILMVDLVRWFHAITSTQNKAI